MKQTGSLGTYFDREAVLRPARVANVLAWVILAFYVYTTFVSIGNSGFWSLRARRHTRV